MRGEEDYLTIIVEHVCVCYHPKLQDMHLEEATYREQLKFPNCSSDEEGGFVRGIFTKNCLNQAGSPRDVCTKSQGGLEEFVYEYARENLVRVEIFIKDKNIDKIVVSEKQPLVWFLANIGGMAGLTTGCSIVTLCEILYFLANWCDSCLRGLSTSTILL